MEWLIIVTLLVALLFIGFIIQKRKLSTLHNNLENAMSQIGIQLSGCFDTIDMILSQLEQYEKREAFNLRKNMKALHITVTAISTSVDVLRQQTAIAEVLLTISTIIQQTPPLKQNKEVDELLTAVETYKKMFTTSCMIYNAGAKKMNMRLAAFPTNIIGKISGYTHKDLL